MEKMKYFIDTSEPYIGNEPIHQELRDKFPKVKENIDDGDV